MRLSILISALIITKALEWHPGPWEIVWASLLVGVMATLDYIEFMRSK